MNEEVSLISFKAICNFINDLSSVYGKNQRSLKLYERLINKTQISHDTAIKRHIDACRKFCIANRDALLSQNSDKLDEPIIQYSERVFINMKNIFQVADNDTKPIIWKHLLTISALVDPAGNAKKILQQNVQEGKSGQAESDFLANIISKVENNVDPNANPMQAISGMMSSGVFNELLSGLQGGSQNGQLDISKLLGAVQGMVSTLQEQAGDDPETKQAMSMLTNMTSMMGNVSQQAQNGQQPDMSNMMSMMTTMMSGMNRQNNTVQEEDEDENEHELE